MCQGKGKERRKGAQGWKYTKVKKAPTGDTELTSACLLAVGLKKSFMGSLERLSKEFSLALPSKYQDIKRNTRKRFYRQKLCLQGAYNKNTKGSTTNGKTQRDTIASVYAA